MRQDVVFPSQGVDLAGWLFTPDNDRGENRPAIVMAHGLSCVKEQGLEPFARCFAAAGFVVLVFDHRCFGTSGGEPRGRLFPLDQVEDYAAALTWLATRPRVDPERLGVWGTSFSGGVVLRLAVTDRRVRAVVAQVPSVVNAENSIFMNPGENGILTRLIHRAKSAPDTFGSGEGTIPVTAGEGEIGVLTGPEPLAMYHSPEWSVPSWRNRITVNSLEKIRDFDATMGIEDSTPTPILMIAADRDIFIPPDLVRRALDRAGEPKELQILPCGHFDIYRTPWRNKAADLATAWFRQFL